MVGCYAFVNYNTELFQDIAIKYLWSTAHCQHHELPFFQRIVLTRNISSSLRLEQPCFLLFLSLTHEKDQYSNCLMEALLLVIDP